MTRKDYELMAKIIKDKLDNEIAYLKRPAAIFGRDEEIMNAYISGVSTIVGAVATAFETDNPRFDSARFAKACGL